jgi:hypothetical protein
MQRLLLFAENSSSFVRTAEIRNHSRLSFIERLDGGDLEGVFEQVVQAMGKARDP